MFTIESTNFSESSVSSLENTSFCESDSEGHSTKSIQFQLFLPNAASSGLLNEAKKVSLNEPSHNRSLHEITAAQPEQPTHSLNTNVNNKKQTTDRVGRARVMEKVSLAEAEKNKQVLSKRAIAVSPKMEYNLATD